MPRSRIKYKKNTRSKYSKRSRYSKRSKRFKKVKSKKRVIINRTKNKKRRMRGGTHRSHQHVRDILLRDARRDGDTSVLATGRDLPILTTLIGKTENEIEGELPQGDESKFSGTCSCDELKKVNDYLSLFKHQFFRDSYREPWVRGLVSKGVLKPVYAPYTGQSQQRDPTILTDDESLEFWQDRYGYTGSSSGTGGIQFGDEI